MKSPAVRQNTGEGRLLEFTVLKAVSFPCTFDQDDLFTRSAVKNHSLFGTFQFSRKQHVATEQSVQNVVLSTDERRFRDEQSQSQQEHNTESIAFPKDGKEIGASDSAEAGRY